MPEADAVAAVAANQAARFSAPAQIAAIDRRLAPSGNAPAAVEDDQTANPILNNIIRSTSLPLSDGVPLDLHPSSTAVFVDKLMPDQNADAGADVLKGARLALQSLYQSEALMSAAIESSKTLQPAQANPNGSLPPLALKDGRRPMSKAIDPSLKPALAQAMAENFSVTAKRYAAAMATVDAAIGKLDAEIERATVDPKAADRFRTAEMMGILGYVRDLTDSQGHRTSLERERFLARAIEANDFSTAVVIMRSNPYASGLDPNIIKRYWEPFQAAFAPRAFSQRQAAHALRAKLQAAGESYRQRYVSRVPVVSVTQSKAGQAIDALKRGRA